MTDRTDDKELKIRKARQADIGELVVLEDLCFDAYYRGHRFTQTEFRYYIRSNRAFCLAATRDSSVVGYIAGVVKRSKSRLLATVDSIAVLAEFRRRGLGGRLLGSMIQEVRSRGCERISLVVAERNETGIRFFVEHGFRKLRSIRSYYSDGIDGYLMVSDMA